MRNQRTSLSPTERDTLEQLEQYVDATGDEEIVTRDDAVAYLRESGYERVEAIERIEQLLLKGYLYEVDDDVRIPPRP